MRFEKESRAEPQPMPYWACLAKTPVGGAGGLSVFNHCRYAGSVADGLCRLLPERIRRCLPVHAGFWVALHDMGKVSPWFQGKYFHDRLQEYSPIWAQRVRNCGTGSLCDHATIGARAYMDIAHAECGDPEVKAIAQHHGFVRTSIPPNTDGPLWQKERQLLIVELEKHFACHLDSKDLCGVNARALAGLTCVSDWIASNADFFPPKDDSIDADELANYVDGVLSDVGFRGTAFRRDLSFANMFGFVPRSEQNALLDAVKGSGIYVMEATMGAGKTEAALAVAYKLIESGRNNGIYFALPTRLTSDRIYLRMQRFLERVMPRDPLVRLSHGRAWLDHYQISGAGAKCRELPSWFAPSKRGLLYPFAVGTIDQALLASMNVRHSFVRLFGLLGKVVILDEVHSYDIYTGSLVRALVRDLREAGCSVVVLSATLTKAQRDALLGCETPVDAPYPLVTGNAGGNLILVSPKADAPEKRIAIRSVESVGAVLTDALDKARRGCNVLCVANTVHQAQNWYRALKQQMNENDAGLIRTGLLHSRFPEFRRSEIERDWMTALGKEGTGRPSGSILVSTQIVEQSVDIDADYLITEMAPIDMLFQRMGRLWRHERGTRPIDEATCTLAFDGRKPNPNNCTDEQFLEGIGKGSCCVYAPYVLMRTLRVLSGRSSLSIPADIRPLLETVYAERTEIVGSVADRFKADLDEKRREMQSAALSAEAHVTSLPTQNDSDDAPPTRYGSRKMVSLLLVKSCDLGAGCRQADLLLLNGRRVRVDGHMPDFSVTKMLYENIVSVPVGRLLGSFARMGEKQILSRHFHDGEMPLLCRVTEDGRIFGVVDDKDVGLSYRDEIGVYEGECASEIGSSEGHCTEDEAFNLEGADW